MKRLLTDRVLAAEEFDGVVLRVLVLEWDEVVLSVLEFVPTLEPESVEVLDALCFIVGVVVWLFDGLSVIVYVHAVSF